MIVVSVRIVAPPRRERVRLAASAKHREREDEEHRERGTIKGTSNKVRVVLEDAGAVVPEVELDEEASKNLAEEDAGLGRVVGDVASVLDQLREVEVSNVKSLDPWNELNSLLDKT